MHNQPQRPTLIPYLTVSDADRSIAFYRNAFGFELIKKSHDDAGSIIHVEMTCANGLIMFAPEGACGDPLKTPVHLRQNCSIGLYMYCADVDVLYETAKAAGAKSRTEPKDMFWGERVCELEDLDGYQWFFAQAG